MTIWQEARGESHEGRVAIGEVIRNRMKQRVHSDGTVAGTVLAPYQFSGYNTKDPNRIPSFLLDDDSPCCCDCRTAWDESETTNLTKGATFYYNPRVVGTPAWAVPAKHVATVGHHEFYAE